MTAASPASPDRPSEVPRPGEKWARQFPTLIIPLILVVCAARAYAGTSGLRIYSHDLFVLLDGAWRILHGQRPHLDFFSILGPLAYLPATLGVWISGGAASGDGVGQAIAAAVLSSWTLILSSSRLSRSGAAATTALVLLLASAPFNVGEAPDLTTDAMTYNRYGYALLIIILLELVAPSRYTDPLPGAVSSGVAVAALFFLKISYFAVAGGILVGSSLLFRRSRRWLAAFIVGGLSLTILTLAFLRFGVHRVFLDMFMTFRAHKFGPRPGERGDADLVGCFWRSILPFGILAAVGTRGRRPEAARRVLLVSILAIVSSVLVLLSNYQRLGMPVLTATILLLWQSGSLSYSRLRPAWHLGIAALAIPLILPVFRDVEGLGFAVEGRLALQPGTFLPFDSPRLSTVSSLEQGYVQFVNDGIDLVRTFRRPEDTIMSLDFSNPFSFALAMPPANGGTPCLHYNSTFSAESHLSAEALFGNASLLAIPKHFSSLDLRVGIPLVYGAAIRKHFRPIAASRAWVLLRRVDEAW